jgi:uncharacterized 2Fe-2S/4Fe-4S cluster protein (DUF4445 family)
MDVRQKAKYTVTFDVVPQPVHVPAGTLLTEAARLAGVQIPQPCGGQGRCGRCAVPVLEGRVRRRSSLHLTAKDIARGYALACQSVVEDDITVAVPPQEKIERRLTTDRSATELAVPFNYDFASAQTVHRLFLSLPEPQLDDQTDDWSRLQIALRQRAGISELHASLAMLQQVGTVLRQGNWQVTVVLDVQKEQFGEPSQARLIALYPGRQMDAQPLWGIAVDIGTTTVTLLLVDLLTGKVEAQVSEYNQQIGRGEDVVSRIIYASQTGGADELRGLVLGTINQLLEIACKRVKSSPGNVVKATIAGNSTMIHLLLGLPAETIRLAPYITSVNHPPLLTAREVGLNIHPEATIDCLPGVASYIGADITAGVLSSGMDDTEKLTLFIDVGTNGEIVLGNRDWLAACACSAGPAFEGAGVRDGMRATRGAIEEVWVCDSDAPTPYEPSYRVIGNTKPRGLCGSGLLSLLAELFLTGVIDKGGNFNTPLSTPRVRENEHGWEYVVVWAEETQHGRDIVFTRTDIDNLLRAKAAIFAGFSVLADSVGVPLQMVEQVLIGGSFGKYINVEKAIQIGLLPDMPLDCFEYLGNTSVKGAYYALLDREARNRLREIASRMTYIELSADNSFYEAFIAALFLPHTDLSRFPSVETVTRKAWYMVLDK